VNISCGQDLLDLQGRFSYTPSTKKEVLIKIKVVLGCGVSDKVIVPIFEK